MADYQQRNLINLMASIRRGLYEQPWHHPILPQLPVEEIAAARHVVLMVLDGLGYQYLREHAAQSPLLKHCRCVLDTVVPTTTATAVSSFFTGLTAAEHGITGWFMQLEAIDETVAILPYTSRRSGEWMQERLPMQQVFTARPLFLDIQRKSYFLNHQRIAKSIFSEVAAQGAQRQAYADLDDFRRQIVENIQQVQASYTYAYWAEFDSLCHIHGTDAEPVHAHFAELEQMLLALLADVQSNNTLLIVTADHGLISTDASRLIHLGDYPEILELLAKPLSGEPRLAYCYVKAGQEAEFLTRVKAQLGEFCEIVPSGDYLAQGYFGPQSHPHIHQRIGDFILLMKENYVIKDQLDGEKDFLQRGVHGGLTAREREIPLLIFS